MRTMTRNAMAVLGLTLLMAVAVVTVAATHNGQLYVDCGDARYTFSYVDQGNVPTCEAVEASAPSYRSDSFTVNHIISPIPTPTAAPTASLVAGVDYELGTDVVTNQSVASDNAGRSIFNYAYCPSPKRVQVNQNGNGYTCVEG